MNSIVVARKRPGRRKSELTCYCSAVPWPHRAGSVERCEAFWYCEHGYRRPEHPDGAEYCPECSFWEAVDYWYDARV